LTSDYDRAVTLTRTAMYASTAIIASVAWFLVGLPSWSSYHTSVAFETLISFVIVACMALSFLFLRDSAGSFPILLLSFFIFVLVIHLGHGIQEIYYPLSPATGSPQRLFADLLEFLIGAILLTGALIARPKSLRRGRSRLLVQLVIAGVMVSCVFSIAGIMAEGVTLATLELLSVLCGSAAFFLLTFCAWRAISRSADRTDAHAVALSVACFLFAASLFPLMASLVTGSIIWTLSLTLQSVAFIALFLSISVPYLKKAGVQVPRAAASSSLIAFVFLVPFLVTLSVEAAVPGYYGVDYDAYVITHTGAASLSALMALLTLTHARRRSVGYLYPMILLYTSWSVVEIGQVLLVAAPLRFTGESLVPYITGSLVTLPSLLLVIRWKDAMSSWASKTSPELWLLIGLLGQGSLLLVGVRLEYLVQTQMSEIIESPLGRSVLLSVNLLVMFEFAYVMIFIVRKFGGRLAPELIMIGFLSLWIVPGVLKANYLDWTAGWWVAEILLLVALLFGPGVLGVMYLHELDRAESEHQRAQVFSDLLVHDVSNYHQAILLSLDLLQVSGVRSDLRANVIREAREELRRADHLIRNVRQLALSEPVGAASLGSRDLLDCIHSAFESACPIPERGGVTFSVDVSSREKPYVLAHGLLEGVFVNLFRNSLKYTEGEKRIEVMIREFSGEGDRFWEVRVEDHGQGIEPARKRGLFGRFMLDAEGTGLGLSVVKTLTESFGGHVMCEDRVAGDHTRGTRFIVRLLKA
jgi:signal transduction histidine kinase